MTGTKFHQFHLHKLVLASFHYCHAYQTLNVQGVGPNYSCSYIYHGCWWPGSLHRQDISIHNTCTDFGMSLCYMRKDFNYLCHVSVGEWYKLQGFLAIRFNDQYGPSDFWTVRLLRNTNVYTHIAHGENWNTQAQCFHLWMHNSVPWPLWEWGKLNVSRLVKFQKMTQEN